MFSSLKLYAALALLLLAIGSIGYYGHTRYAAGQTHQIAFDQKVTDRLQAQLASDAQAITQANQAATQAQADAANQKAYATAAIADLRQVGAQQVKQAAAWQAKLHAAEQSKGCQAQLQEQLCPAISSY